MCRLGHYASSNNTGLAGSRREIKNISAVQKSADGLYGRIALESGGEAQIIGNHRARSRGADPHAHAGDRAAKRQISRDSEVFLRLIETAKVVPGIDHQMVRAVGNAALKKAD